MIQKIISVILMFSLITNSACLSIHAETPLSDMRVESDMESVKNISQCDSLVTFPNGSKDKGELKKHQEDDFDNDYKPSKWEITKNVAKYAAQKFVYDLKSYIKFYPVMQIAQGITFLAWFLPGYALYKKTGKDITAPFSNFAMNHENLAIIMRNLYNVIPMTLASLIYKYGQQAYANMKG